MTDWKQFPQIVGIAGRKQHGKTTCARALPADYQVLSFAEPIRDMLRALGVPERSLSRDKEVPVPDILCGKTARWAMQSLGTEWGRDAIGQDIWTEAWGRKVWAQMVANPDARIVVDDVRFPNEVTKIQAMGGVVIRVTRPGGGRPPRRYWWQFWRKPDHPSERHIDTLAVDATVENTGDLDEFRAAFLRAVLQTVTPGLSGYRRRRS